MENRPRGSVRYAVVFRASAGPPIPGALMLEDDRVILEGRGPAGHITLTVPYPALTSVRVGRTPAERLNGRVTLILERAGEPTIQVEPLGIGFLQELASLLATLTPRDMEGEEQVAVIVPLKEGRADRARALVAEGPPFDPAALGLTRHQVFVTDLGAIFVFTGREARAKIQAVSRDPRFWRLGLSWRDCAAGRPRIASAAELDAARAEPPAFSWAAAG